MLIVKVRLSVEPDEDRFHGYCPDLPGVHADGDTFDEAIERLREAAKVHLKGLVEAEAPLPVTVLNDENWTTTSPQGDETEDIPVRAAVP